MEYVYAALLIHKAGGQIDEPTVTKVLESAGVTVDQAKVKALIASLDGVNIDEAISKAVVAPVAAQAAAPAAASATEEKKEEPKEEPKENPEAASAGLSALFG